MEVFIGLVLILSFLTMLGGIIWIIVNAIRKDSLKKPIITIAGGLGVFVLIIAGSIIDEENEKKYVREQLVKVNKEFNKIHDDAQEATDTIDDLGNELTSTWHDAIFGDEDKDFQTEVSNWQTDNLLPIMRAGGKITDLETKIKKVKDQINDLDLELTTAEQNKLYALDKLVDHLNQYKKQAVYPTDSLKNHDDNTEKALDKVKEDIDQIGTSFN